MKKLLLLFMIFTTLNLYGQSKTETAITNAANSITNKNYSDALNQLKSADQSDYRVQYFEIRATHELYKSKNVSDFESIHGLRQKVNQYLNLHKSKMSSFTEYVNQTRIQLNEIQPAQTEQEYLAMQKERERKEKLLELEDSFTNGNYHSTLILVNKYKSDADIDPEYIAYYEAMAKFYLLENNRNASFNEIKEVENLQNNYIKKYTSTNRQFTTIMEGAITSFKNKFPATEEEYIAFKEEQRKQKIAEDLKDKMEVIRSEYTKSNYFNMMRLIGDFPDGTEYDAEILYFKTMYEYNEFDQITNKNFDHITAIRNRINISLANPDLSKSAFFTKVNQLNNYLKSHYPETRKEFDQIQLKKVQEEQARIKANEKENERIRKENRAYSKKKTRQGNFRKGYLALGYEGGMIAKYGIRFEMNGRNTVGFFFNARSSFINDSELLESIEFLDNKNEAVIGPSFKIAKFLILNIGAGYGFYKFKPGQSHYVQDYNNYDPDGYYNNYLETQEYYTGYGGITIRLGNRFNLIGGLSMMNLLDQNVDFDPEYTFGLTINLR